MTTMMISYFRCLYLGVVNKLRMASCRDDDDDGDDDDDDGDDDDADDGDDDDDDAETDDDIIGSIDVVCP